MKAFQLKEVIHNLGWKLFVMATGRWRLNSLKQNLIQHALS